MGKTTFTEILRLIPDEERIVVDFYESGVVVFDEVRNIIKGYAGSDIMELSVDSIYNDGESLAIAVRG